MTGIISPTMVSNLICHSICAPHDARQAIGSPYTMPDEDTRRLRAQLILEEALETIAALGFEVMRAAMTVNKHSVKFLTEAAPSPDMEGIIDGCADLNYVLTGTLVTCGVPDQPHYTEVCMANEDKLRHGVTVNAAGKFMKPEGWEPPDHAAVQEMTKGVNLQELARLYHAGYLKIKGKK